MWYAFQFEQLTYDYVQHTFSIVIENLAYFLKGKVLKLLWPVYWFQWQMIYPENHRKPLHSICFAILSELSYRLIDCTARFHLHKEQPFFVNVQGVG